MPNLNESTSNSVDFAQRIKDGANQRPRLVESQLDPGAYLRGSGELEILFPGPAETQAELDRHGW